MFSVSFIYTDYIIILFMDDFIKAGAFAVKVRSGVFGETPLHI